MAKYFDIDTKYEDIMLDMLNNQTFDSYTAHFITGETITFNRHEMSDNIIAEIIESKIDALREKLGFSKSE